jgi:RecA-family ATPase
VAAGKDWIGTVPEGGPVIYLSAEDDLDEIHRRLADITAAQGIDLAALTNFHIVPLAGEDAVLGAPDRRSGLIAATPLWRALVAEVAKIRPRLLVIDSLADVFGGNENDRPRRDSSLVSFEA